MTNHIETVNLLAEKAGILPEFSAEGGIYKTSFETQIAVLNALGIDACTPEKAEAALQAELEKPFKRALPPVVVARIEKGVADVPVTVRAKGKHSPIDYVLTLESGEQTFGQAVPAMLEKIDDNGEFERVKLVLDLPDVMGYHSLTVESPDLPETGRTMTLVVAPTKCYQPEMMREGGKPWGYPLQLYALRSAENWGIGDFTDLGKMAGVAQRFGADILGINPINVAFMANVETASPYYSSSRLFLNPLYIDVTAVEGAQKSKKLQALLADKDFQAKLEKARASRLVDYALVGELKGKAFEALYAEFKGSADFDAFCEKGGKELDNAALYQVLAESFVLKKKGVGFKSWGKAYDSPDTAQAKKFAREHADRIRYFKYLFWLADAQFKAASEACKAANLGVGLYQDLAVGVAAESAETWGAQELFAVDLSIGSPPDMFNADGQRWGVAPMRPEVMKQEAYATYRRILSANMKRAGAVRIDHVMGLARLFCIPDGVAGAYVLYPFADMVGIVALESHRNKCLVVGEDLGVVPSFFREALAEAGILSFRVCRYERTPDGRYIPPASYPESALVAAGTHDMPTLTGWWTGGDIDAARKIGLMDEQKEQSARAERYGDRFALVEALSRVGLWFVESENFESQINGALPPKMIEKVYTYLAQAPCQVFLVQLEDVLHQAEQMNMPGTCDEYPNWRFKLPKTIEELDSDENMEKIANILKAARS
ncbi:MAG TPA: 4-alpha-glucanotransferase [Alphaproteobacteria bacterium]|nr:4-alpha-glucanotransferase [Alphaproteobacteria bacterium]